MKFSRTIQNNLIASSGCVLTIGNFDAVHIGHQKIVKKLVRKGQELGVPAVLITFSPSPQVFFKGENAEPEITSISERYLALRELGLAMMIALPFRRALANTAAHDFIKSYIVDGLHTRYLYVGDDFRFGVKRAGNYTMLESAGKEYGFGVGKIETVLHDGARISSTRVRQSLGEGDFSAVTDLIGRDFRMVGRVTHGDKRGRQWGFPTLNLPLRKSPPLRGVFAVQVLLESGDYVNGVANLGNRPTVDGLKTLLEVHLFDFSEEIYGQRICVRFIEKIRDEQKFDSFESLKEQIEKDCKVAMKTLDKIGLNGPE